jgi:Flp pilus assembly protein TadG
MNPAPSKKLGRVLSHHRILRKLIDIGRRLLSGTDGGIAVVFAFSMVPMVLATLGVVQYGLAVSTKTKLDAIADAASLQAVSSVAVLAYLLTPTAGQTNATNMFNAQAALMSGVTISSLNVSVTSTLATPTTPSGLTATVSYTAKITNLVPGFLGTNFTTVSGSSTATTSLPTYTNFYLLLDDSPSMGIGATPADIALMGAVNNGCGFACHSPNALFNPSYPGYILQTVPGTTLRIDAMRSAVNQLITTAVAQQVITNQYQIGLYTFANSVTTVSPLSANLTQALVNNNLIQLPTTNVGTQIGDAVNWLSQNVVTTASGNGTQALPYKFVFLVTDGVEDQGYGYIPGSYDNLIAPTGTYPQGSTPALSAVMNSNACTSLKNKGVTVAVLYTTYDPLTDPRYTYMVKPFASNIVSALTACASTGFFFTADSASDINTAMQQMFAQALLQVSHLSQ